MKLSKIFGTVKNEVSEDLNLFLIYFAVLHDILMFAVAPPVIIFFCFYLTVFTKFWWIIFLYGIWFFFDRKTQQRGGRPTKWYKNCFLWRYYKLYFPLRLEKTFDLPADRNYLFGYHPHGLMCLGMANLGTNVTGFDELFPGLITHPLTLRIQFFIPFRREYLMLCGCSEASVKNIRYLLSHPEKGHVAILCVGGAKEEMETKAGVAKLVLNERKGFIRLALENGADLVPTFTFGENEVYAQLFSNAKGTWYRWFMEFIKSWFGFPIFFCQSLLPKRMPLTTIVGKPVEVKKPIENPNNELIDEYRGKYRQNLVELFEKNKTRFGYSKNFHLQFI